MKVDTTNNATNTSEQNVTSEDWIRKKLNISHDNLDDIKTVSLPGSYNEKITHLGSSLCKFIRLKELDLSRNAIVCLEGLESLKLLEKLNLYYNCISSIHELERLKYNTSLTELDLRLNPVTKEENDYRLILIQILPDLKVLDDRAIRDQEKQMASSYFDQGKFIVSSSGSGSNNGNSGLSSLCSPPANSTQEKLNAYCSSGVSARVKSVSNIAKRSAGLSEADDPDSDMNFNNMCMRAFDMNKEEKSYQKAELKAEEYSPNELKELGNRDYYKNSNNNQGESLSSSRELTRQKSLSLHNLRASQNNIDSSRDHRNSIIMSGLAPNKSKSVHFNEINDYQDCSSYLNMHSTDPHADETDAYNNNMKSRATFTANPYYEPEHQVKNDMNEQNAKSYSEDAQSYNNPLFGLLDMVDRYWNGTKSLHKNAKFLGAANQLFSEHNNQASKDNKSNIREQLVSLQNQVNQFKEENMRLQQQLMQRSASKKSSSSSSEAIESQYKELLGEIESIKKKYAACQEENKQLRKEISEVKNEKMFTNDLNSIENENMIMKRDVEIMKIKLKQYEQLQQLTSMLQESHKSLVSTNDHLLQEINKHRHETKQHNRGSLSVNVAEAQQQQQPAPNNNLTSLTNINSMRSSSFNTYDLGQNGMPAGPMANSAAASVANQAGVATSSSQIIPPLYHLSHMHHHHEKPSSQGSGGNSSSSGIKKQYEHFNNPSHAPSTYNSVLSGRYSYSIVK